MRSRIVSLLGVASTVCGAVALAPVASAESVEVAPAVPQACDGTWQLMDSPQNAKKSRSMLGVDTLSASDAWAVGWETPTAGGYQKPLSQHWDGSAWTIVKTPLPQGARSGILRSVVALSPTDVWAVGEYENADGTANLALSLRWNGTKWKTVSTGLLGSNTRAYGIDAADPNSIWMVGRTAAGFSGDFSTFAAHWTGSKWSVVPTPNKPGSVQNWLQDVSVASDGDVWAVGAWTDFATAHGLIEHWNGSAWSIEKSPPSFELRGVAAIKANDAWASGLTGQSTYEIEHWNGTKWAAKNGALGSDAAANAMSAAAADDVWVMGNDSGDPLTQHWNGTSWVTVPTEPLVADILVMEDVSVTSDGRRAYAVGEYLNVDVNRFRTLVYRWC